MPVKKPEVSLFDVEDLTLHYQDGRYGLSLRCPRATAYVLCFAKRKPPADPFTLNLTENELYSLHQGQSLDRNGYHLMGVSAGSFHAMPRFFGFQAIPPQTIQVWSMLAKPDGTVELYAPRGQEKVCHVPLRYAAKYLSENGMTQLFVQLEERYLTDYKPGQLRYQISGGAPVPLPKSWLNRAIPLRAEPGQITVSPSPEAAQDYERIG